MGPDFYVPRKTNNTNVPNQDIKGTVFLDAQGEFKDVDYLIVAPNYLRAQAERLAQINRTQHNLNVKVYSFRIHLSRVQFWNARHWRHSKFCKICI